jgi:SPP1 family predicted phage head-tail adaptor
LRNYVEIQKQDDTGSGWNGTRTWSTYANAWADIRPLRGTETNDDDTKKREADISHVITLRFVRGLKPSMRIVFEGRKLLFEAIRNLDERNRTLEIDAREETDV